jgi:hypothetical protein
MPAEPLPTTLLHDRMPDWWRPLGLDLGGDRLALRRRGVEALRSALSLENVVDTVAYAHGDHAGGERIIGTIRAAARSADGAFAGDLGDAETQALAAAALADQLAVDPDSEISTVVSLLVLSANYGGHASAIEGIRLPEYAARQLEHRAASARRETTLVVRPTASEMVADRIEALQTIAAMGGTVADTAVGAILSGHADILVELAGRIDDAAARADAEHAVLREQLRQQTWLFESWCEKADVAWSDVPAAARPLVAAVELAERTSASAPAIDVDTLLGSLLTAAGGAGEVEPFAGVFAAAPYLGGRLTAAPNAMLFPLATALSRWRKRRGDDDWETGEGRMLPTQQAVTLSLQAYREALALRVLGYE